MSSIPIVITGAAGRMGQRLIALAGADPDLKIVAAVESPNHPRLGEDAGEIAGVGKLALPIIDHFDAVPSGAVVIDFSSPEATDAIISACLNRELSLVYATTGAATAQMDALRRAAHKIAVLWSPSMSTTVNLTMKLAETAAMALKNLDADVEILERHHRFKADAPSGTALKFGQIIAEKMGIDRFVHGREGKTGARPHHEIGYHAIRVGDNPGEHTIIFGLLGETIELTVRASNRDAYAIGALNAAKFLADKKVGFFNMNDLLNL